MLHEAVMAQALNSSILWCRIVSGYFSGAIRERDYPCHASLSPIEKRRRNLGNELAQDVFGELFSGFDDAH